jgi:hypothetical protein
MKKIFKNAAALVAAALVMVSLLSGCSREESWTASVDNSYSVIYDFSTSVENGCPVATATGTAKANNKAVASAILKVTLAEEQIAISSDENFGTSYTSGDWETKFEYSDGQTATVTFEPSDSQLVLLDLVFNKATTEEAADGKSAKITLSYTARLAYRVDGVTEATADVVLKPWYTQVKIENTPSVVEPEENFSVVSFELKEFFGNNHCRIYGVWTIESNGATYSEKACFAEFNSDAVYQSGVIVSRSASLKETRHEFVSLEGETTTNGNLTLKEDTLVLYETINLGNVNPIDDTRSMIVRDVTFTDPVTGESHHLDVTGYMTSDYKEVVEEGRETITTGGDVKYSYDGKSVLFTTYYHISYTYNGETVEYTPVKCSGKDYHYSGYHYED